VKIALVIASLQSGGAERVAINLARGFANDGNQVSLITLSSQQTDFYDVPNKVGRVALDCMTPSSGFLSALRSNRKRVSLIRNALHDLYPEVTISFCTETNVLVLLASSNLATKVVITEHSDPVRNRYGMIWQIMRRLLYARTDKLVCVSRGVAKYFDWIQGDKVHVINNPVLIGSTGLVDEELPAGVDESKKWITSVGRMDFHKGIDLIIGAVAKIRNEFGDWQLILIGDGELREELELLSRKHQLGYQVVFVGKLQDPHQLVRRSKLFVMGSRFEGFPMAHAEALMCGVPVVATNCPSGPSEMIEHGVNGLLVPPEDADSLSKAMLCVMKDAEMQTRMAHAAVGIKSRLGLAPIMRQWQDLFDRF
jgi:GalNAc-alpha-(1->4)-GalNAc-alpha-(1->3)-diNAcBac-PP-undecaprenol alpha-1,4-N-acetyl-D-galactosaminyltransferase